MDAFSKKGIPALKTDSAVSRTRPATPYRAGKCVFFRALIPTLVIFGIATTVKLNAEVEKHDSRKAVEQTAPVNAAKYGLGVMLASDTIVENRFAAMDLVKSSEQAILKANTKRFLFLEILPLLSSLALLGMNYSSRKSETLLCGWRNLYMYTQKTEAFGTALKEELFYFTISTATVAALCFSTIPTFFVVLFMGVGAFASMVARPIIALFP